MPLPTIRSPRRKTGRFIALILLIASVLWIIWRVQSHHPQDRTITLSEFLRHVDAADVRAITITGTTAQGAFMRTGDRFRTTLPADASLYKELYNHGIEITMVDHSDEFWHTNGITILAVITGVGILLILWMLVKAVWHRPEEQLDFTRAKPRPNVNGGEQVTLKDIAGIDEVIADVQNFIYFLGNPSKFTRYGAHIPRGVLLVGPPGTGKTLLARAIAGEVNALAKEHGDKTPKVAFFSISGSEFAEMFVGVAAARVRDLFREARKKTPCIIFIDEIDALAHRRAVAGGGGQAEHDQALNEVLVQLDGFDARTEVIVIAATNRVDVLDPALLRPGRFDRHITLDLPTAAGREAIFQVHLKTKPVASDVDVPALARRTFGFSGADIMTLVNEATLVAARDDKGEQPPVVRMADFERCIDRIIPNDEKLKKTADVLRNRIPGQQRAAALLAAAASLHYTTARFSSDHVGVPRKRPSVLLVGSHGCGKTTLVKTLAEHLAVPIVFFEASRLAAVHDGQVLAGGATQRILRELLIVAGSSTQRARYGIVCITGLEKVLQDDFRNKATLRDVFAELGTAQFVDVPFDSLRLQTARMNVQDLFLVYEATAPELGAKLASVQQGAIVGLGEYAGPVETFLLRHGFPELARVITCCGVLQDPSPAELESLLRAGSNTPLVQVYERFLKMCGIEIDLSSVASELAKQAAVRSRGFYGIASALHDLCLLAAAEKLDTDSFRSTLNSLSGESAAEKQTSSEISTNNPGPEAANVAELPLDSGVVTISALDRKSRIVLFLLRLPASSLQTASTVPSGLRTLEKTIVLDRPLQADSQPNHDQDSELLTRLKTFRDDLVRCESQIEGLHELRAAQQIINDVHTGFIDPYRGMVLIAGLARGIGIAVLSERIPSLRYLNRAADILKEVRFEFSFPINGALRLLKDLFDFPSEFPEGLSQAIKREEDRYLDRAIALLALRMLGETGKARACASPLEANRRMPEAQHGWFKNITQIRQSRPDIESWTDLADAIDECLRALLIGHPADLDELLHQFRDGLSGRSREFKIIQRWMRQIDLLTAIGDGNERSTAWALQQLVKSGWFDIGRMKREFALAQVVVNDQMSLIAQPDIDLMITRAQKRYSALTATWRLHLEKAFYEAENHYDLLRIIQPVAEFEEKIVLEWCEKRNISVLLCLPCIALPMSEGISSGAGA
jgi:ATP-dependent Zn protease